MWSNRLIIAPQYHHWHQYPIIIIIFTIIMKGEDGETFYFLEEGQARVMISRGDGEESQQVVVVIMVGLIDFYHGLWPAVFLRWDCYCCCYCYCCSQVGLLGPKDSFGELALIHERWHQDYHSPLTS